MASQASEAKEPSYNMKLYGYLIKEQLPFWTSKHDLVWLTNQLGNILRRNKYQCVDNIRVCRAGFIFGHATSKYMERHRQGCCGFFDKKVTNPLTNNSFWIGFNHGH